MEVLMRFFSSLTSEKPFCGRRAFSKYSLVVSARPVSSTSCKAKSLMTQRKLGKYSDRLSPDCLSDLTVICFAKFKTSDMLESADSSIDPTELYTKHEANSTAKLKILESCVESSSSAPIPSVSMSKILQGSPLQVLEGKGLPQIHIPLVQGLIEGPTPKPLFRPSST